MAIKISQIYGGGGNAGATYKNDYIELYNTGTSDVILDGTYALHYTSATGTSYLKANLTGTILAGGYFLCRGGSSGSDGATLPTIDFDLVAAAGSWGMSSTTGKVFLTNTQTALSGGSSACIAPLTGAGGASTCPATQSAIVDMVGYGATANVYEGTGRTPTLTVTNAAFRAGAGATDTDDNSADFSITTPSARNSAATTGFTNPTNAYASDNTYATFTATSGAISVSLSKDAGANYQNVLTKTFGASDTTETYGNGSTELWGSTWTGDDVDDTSFRLKISQGAFAQVYKTFGFAITSSLVLTGIEVTVEAKYSGSTASIDHVRVKIYYGTAGTTIQAGSVAYASDGRKNGEGAGAGTGVMVFRDGSAWRAVDTGATVAA